MAVCVGIPGQQYLTAVLLPMQGTCFADELFFLRAYTCDSWRV